MPNDNSFDDVIDGMDEPYLEEEPVDHDREEQQRQITEALKMTQSGGANIITPPFRNMFGVTSNFMRGQIVFLVAFSGNGKTTLAMEMADRFATSGQKVRYMGLESAPRELRSVWACRRVAIHPGDYLSGVCGSEEVARVREELLRQSRHEGIYANLRFAPAEFVSVTALRLEVEQAFRMGTDVFVIDHIDHIEGDNGASGWAESKAVNQELVRLARKYPMLYLVTSQLNNEALKGDRIAAHLPPRPQMVYMGGHKRHICAMMLGAYRPLRKEPSEPGALEEYLKRVKAVRSGNDHDVARVLEPGCMEIVLMKHRFYGEREGNRFRLKLTKGRLRDWTSEDDAMAALQDGQTGSIFPPSHPGA